MAEASTIAKLFGLCGGCLLRTVDVHQVEPKHVYQRFVTFFGGRVAVTEAMCPECWRLLFELKGVDVGMHRLERAEGSK